MIVTVLISTVPQFTSVVQGIWGRAVGCLLSACYVSRLKLLGLYGLKVSCGQTESAVNCQNDITKNPVAAKITEAELYRFIDVDVLFGQ